MSKILELLAYKKRTAAKKEEREVFSPPVSSENLDSDTKDKLASTYIFNPIDNLENINKDSDEQRLPHASIRSRSTLLNLFPWLIAFLAVLLLLVNIVYRGKININIEFAQEDSSQIAPSAFAQQPFEKHPVKDALDTVPQTTILVTGNEVNGNIVKKMGFYGAALSQSRVIKDGLLLGNDGTAGWASAGFDLTRPLDVADSSLDFFIKGADGDESLELILRDADTNTYLPQARNNVFIKNMGKDWQFVSISFKDFDGYYNPGKVNHIGFEFGTQTTSNEPGASIFIKNIRIVKHSESPDMKIYEAR